MLALILAGALLEPQIGGRAAAPEIPAPPSAVEFKVIVAAPVYQPDGAVSSETTMLSNGATSVVYVYGRRSICDTATQSTKEPADAGFGWRLMAQTISQTPTELIVGVDWRRVWDRGQRISNGPGATVHLTLHPGDRIPLDQIPNLTQTDACRAVGLGLEIKLARTTSTMPAVPSNAVLPIGAIAGGATLLDADLWLVDTQAAGGQKSVHQMVRVPKDGGTFSFDPVNLSTPLGPIDVEFSGALRRFQVSSQNSEYLLLQLTRVITGAATPPGGYRGNSVTPMSLPGPAEVLSFEMPGSQGQVRGGRGGLASAGGAGGGRGGGGAGGAGGRAATPAGGAVMRQPAPTGSSAVAEIAQSARGAARMVLTAQPAVLLDGHVFALRVRLTPVAGS